MPISGKFLPTLSLVTHSGFNILSPIARQNHDAWPIGYEHFNVAFDETDRILTELMDNFQIQNAIDALRRLNILLDDVQDSVTDTNKYQRPL